MDHVIVVDYGSQYTRLITRRLRELGAYSLIVTPEELSSSLDDTPAAVVLSGGPASVHGGPVPSLPQELLEGDAAVLGICYGMQLLAREMGGEVEPGSVREYGKAVLNQCDGRLFDGLEGEFVAWMSHGDSVKSPPAGFKVTASSADTPVAAMESEDGRLFGLQFHPEVLHTPKGMEVLERFLDASRARRDWTPEHVVDTLISEVQERVGDERVLLAVSGGVDSSTLGLLLNRALGDRLHAVFVDHGLLRMGEAEEVDRALRSLGVNLKTVDASDQFIADLEGVSDPEEKRKIIGRDFIEVFTAEAKQLQAQYGEIRFLAQGTLYPDVIESAGGHGAANIKSHHNVGGLPEKLGFELLEPFRTLFKDEVREVAAMLGMPPALRERHPFPGPGLAIRCLGPVSRERLEVLRRVDDIFIGALREFGLYDLAWQALAVLTPIRSVGVMGDGRTYANTVALRAVSSVDGMTADWTRFPDEFLATVSNRIVNRVSEVNRVVYDITSKPPGTIEWE